jgi:asparagine synthetase B (glutamine-hydrolysing)
MQEEFYIQDGSLITEDDWLNIIARVRNSLGKSFDDAAEARKSLSACIVRAVVERIPEKGKFGLLFSGGVDSSLIALILKKAGKDFPCYTLGFKNPDTKDPEDMAAAEKTAGTLGLHLRKKIIDAKEASELLKRTVKTLGSKLNNVVNVGVASVELGCIEMAKKDGVDYLFGGLGSEELFAGYHRHRQASDKQEE